jgi:hypothetical protein
MNSECVNGIDIESSVGAIDSSRWSWRQPSSEVETFACIPGQVRNIQACIHNQAIGQEREEVKKVKTYGISMIIVMH